MSSIAQHLQHVQQQIAQAAGQAGRVPSSVQLLAVSKTFGPEAVAEAVAAGQRAFGENYLQEALDKIAALPALVPDTPLEWHFIGPIQSNKTRPIAEHFDWVHSVDRLKIAQRLSEQRPEELGPLNICLQVNISAEASKSGLTPEELPEVAAQVAQLPRLRLRGLMAIPAPSDDMKQQRAAFAAVRGLYEQLRTGGLPLDTLSMGMSADLEAAVAEGATIVRVGSAIFGARHYA
ncbi:MULTISPECIES: YggS family pyridoxal phosphate-dependent enzyme [unclassified Herbaspirillum]|mgnify:FL=1|uniref:YggS family pyridoxal phosphate-dependent enzyme n=1 Tax=unclassified Herbaspirillum TaxID=2624150 RepID=UPI000C0A7D6A|nr:MULTISPECIES: YggS family pyridoxal phosphate-dependent enzyme [unclassified Herbaspirillum]MAF02451.1 YggS family pyridoxal phosphate-dependent enzyme [Herbaspirillum sp.]MBO17241.1 YggS family pyridoxal phosphate-dependent enzyme [Herbaspirillum sp.]|tara:strand:+ start:9780 stop:10481 length:702 start_codon:yes stop_codon:yes gene_type:complete